MKSKVIVSALVAIGIGAIVSLGTTPAYAHPCTYGSYTDHASGTTYYYWFHNGEYVGSSTSLNSPPAACRPH
ncbi:MAG: hypothetical protein WD803_07770 [Gammaproteobacteria bacterium]